jgi:alanyl-tRNA synthetase
VATVGEAGEAGPVRVLSTEVPLADQRQLLDLASRVQSKLGGESAIVLGGADGGRAALVALVSKGAVSRGVSAAGTIHAAAPLIGGGGGGRDEMAQAGGKDPSRLDDALAAARQAIEKALA